MTQHDITPLIAELMSLKPGEVREHAAVVHEIAAESRFLRVNTTGEALLAHTPFWKNEPKPELVPSRTPRPRRAHFPELPPVRLSASEPPVVVFDGKSAEFGHLYRQSWATMVSEALLGCILELDGDAIEYVPATIVDRAGKVRGDLHRCFFILPSRAIDCIDTARTTVRLSCEELAPGILMRNCEFDGYAVRTDIPANFHIFSNVFNGDLVLSMDLINQVRARPIWGIWARRTEKGMTETSISF